MEQSLNITQIIKQINENHGKSLLFISQNQLRIQTENLSKQNALKRYFQLSSKQWVQDGKKRNWAFNQIQLLIYLTDKVCFHLQKSLEFLTKTEWNAISNAFPLKNQQDCMFKMLNLKKYSLSQFPWTDLQNECFKELIQQYGHDWNKISKKLYYKNNAKVFRNSKSCKQHFACFFDPNNIKGHWSHQEDYKLALLYLKLGRKWSKIAKEIQGRNQNAIKNRFFLVFQSKKQKKIKNNSEIQERVRKYVNKYQKQHENSNSLKNVQQKTQIIFEQKHKDCINTAQIQNNEINIGRQEGVQKDNQIHQDALNFLSYFNQSNYFNCLDI